MAFSERAATRAVASVCCAEREGVCGGLASRLQRSIHLNLRLQLTPYKEVQLIRALSSGRQQWSPNAETPTSGGPGERRMGACVLMGGGRAGQSAPEWDALQAMSPEHEFSPPFPSESNYSITARHENSTGRFGRSTEPLQPVVLRKIFNKCHACDGYQEHDSRLSVWRGSVCGCRYSRPDKAALIVLPTQAERSATLHRRGSGDAAGLTFTAAPGLFAIIGPGTNTEGQRSEPGSRKRRGSSRGVRSSHCHSLVVYKRSRNTQEDRGTGGQGDRGSEDTEIDREMKRATFS